MQSGILFDVNVFLASVSIGLMGVNVLIVNNYRDMEDDKEAGKRTSVVIVGRKVASIIYLLNGCVAIILMLPMWVSVNYIIYLIPVLYLLLHVVIWRKLVTNSGAALNPLLGATSINMLMFSILITLYWSIG